MIEKMKQWLQALEYPLVTSHEAFDVDMAELLAHRAIESLRQTIADFEKQEPVAWRFKTGTFWNREPHWRYVLSLEGTEGLQGLEPLYTHPQPKREPLEQELYEALVEMQNIMYAEAGVRSVGVDKLIAKYEAAHSIKE